MQSPQSEATPRRLTLSQTLTFYLFLLLLAEWQWCCNRAGTIGREEMAPFCPLAKHNEGEAWHIVCGSFQKPFVCS